MSMIDVAGTQQAIEVVVQTQTIVVANPSGAVSILNAGPIGPPGMNGLSGDYDATQLLVEMDTKIATHNQATPVHTTATSGRDFAALFQNGLI